MRTSSPASSPRVTFQDADLGCREVIDPSAEGLYWAPWTAAWTSLPVGHSVDGHLLCGLLTDRHSAAAMRTARFSDQLLPEVMVRVANAPAVPIVVHPRTWPQIEAAQRAAQSEAMRAAIHRAPVGRRVVERFKAVLRSLARLVRPWSACAARRVDLAEGSAPATGKRTSATADPLVANMATLQRDLLRSAKEIRRPGDWSGLGGEIAVAAVTRLGRWPQGRPLHIEDPSGRVLARLGDDAWKGEPVRVSLDSRRAHYSAIVDGQIVDVPADGDCFFASVLTAMSPPERRRLLMAWTGSGLTAKPAQARLRQYLADTVERMARHPAATPEPVVNAWVAHRA